MYVRAMGNLCTFQLFCCESKTALKKRSLLKKCITEGNGDFSSLGKGHVDFF